MPCAEAQRATAPPQAPQTTAVTRRLRPQSPRFVPHAGRRRACGRQRSSARPTATAAAGPALRAS